MNGESWNVEVAIPVARHMVQESAFHQVSEVVRVDRVYYFVGPC
jgi:hypothetical protein